MGPENLSSPNPLEELTALGGQLDKAQDLSALKTLFRRVDEIARQHSDDFDIQLAVRDLKQRMMDRGSELRAAGKLTPPVPLADSSPPARAQTAADPTAPMDYPVPTPSAPRKLMSSGQFSAPRPLSAADPTPLPVPRPSGPPTAVLPPGSPATPKEEPPPTAAVPVAPDSPPPPPAVMLPDRPPAMRWKRAVGIGALVGVIVAIGGITVIVKKFGKPQPAPGAAPIAVQVSTVPAKASIQVNGEDKCISDCELNLPAGTYQISAVLEGYDPAGKSVTVEAGKPATLSFTLQPQPPYLRILTDLDQGKVTLDSQPPVDLQEGQFFLDKIPAGEHTVKIGGRSSEASFSFAVEDAKMPLLSGKPAATNANITLVTSLGGHARVATAAGRLKLILNGEPEAPITPEGVDLAHYQTGVNEFQIGEGATPQNLKENFASSPGVTAFVKTDRNIGTLVIATGESGVQVFINNKLYPRLTQRGELRILQPLGAVTVRVAKQGFDAIPQQQNVEIKRDAEARLTFQVTEPVLVLIRGGTPGAEVKADGKNLGVIGPDGNLNSSVAAGDHVLEFTLDKFLPKRIERTFKGPQPITLSGADVQLAPERPVVAETKKVDVPPPPPPPAPVKVTAPPPAPVIKNGTMADFENPNAWTRDDDVWLHKGQAFIPYGLTPRGTFTFSIQLVKGGGIFGRGKMRWVANYIDAKNYALFELDNKNFVAKDVVKGKTSDRTRAPINMEKTRLFTIQMEISPERITHRLQNGSEWINLDTWPSTGSHNFTEGKFGFMVQGDDEIGISGFRFVPSAP